MFSTTSKQQITNIFVANLPKFDYEQVYSDCLLFSFYETYDGHQYQIIITKHAHSFHLRMDYIDRDYNTDYSFQPLSCSPVTMKSLLAYIDLYLKTLKDRHNCNI